MESVVLLHSQWGDLLPHLLEYGGLGVFHPSDFMRQLETVYRNTVYSLVPRPHPQMGKGLVTFERFLDCAVSAVM